MSDVSRHIPNYILVASGPMTHDALNITIYDKELEPAREQAMRHVKHLVKAGYYQFHLFQTRIPDCLCGRDEFAAENIELIDTILTMGRFGALSDWEPEHVDKAIEYVRSEKQRNGFRERVPYLV